MKALGYFDHRATLAIQHLPKSWLPAMSAVSFLGEPTVVLPIALAGFVSAIGRHQSQVQHAFAYGFIAFIINTLLKLALRRRRPDNLDIKTLGLQSYSFPSGHAFGTVMFYGLFSYLDYRYLSHPYNWVISAVIWLLILVIGISRVYLKYHFPSDVAAGWVLGLVSLWIVVSLSF